MKLYAWRSRALKNYGLGWMMAIAASPEEARQLVLKKFEEYFWEESFMEKDDPDDLSMYEIELGMTVEDLSAIPMETEALFIAGSE